MSNNDTSFEELEDIMWRHVVFSAEQTGKDSGKLVEFANEAECIAVYKNKNDGAWFAALYSNYHQDKARFRDPKDPNDQEHFSFFYYQCALLTGKYAAKKAMGSVSVNGRYQITEEHFDKALDKTHRAATKAALFSSRPVAYNACA